MSEDVGPRQFASAVVLDRVRPETSEVICGVLTATQVPVPLEVSWESNLEHLVDELLERAFPAVTISAVVLA